MSCILALDLGRRYIGLAISDPDQKIAFPREVWKTALNDNIILQIGDYIKKNRISKIILGRPVSFKGHVLPLTSWVDQIASQIKQKLKVPVILVDERLSTREAHHLLSKRSRPDAAAAALFLQTYLDLQQARQKNKS